MADVALLHQEILLLKLRITALEAQKSSLEDDVALAEVNLNKAQTENQILTGKLIKANADVGSLELEVLRERRTSNAAMKKIEQLENELEDALGSDSDAD
jgi:chromosome segregation ATPase